MQHIAAIWQRTGAAPRARGADPTVTRGAHAADVSRVTTPTTTGASSVATPTTSTGATGRAAEALLTDVDEEVLLLEGDRATEAAFKGLARGRRVLHLATHGFFLDRFCGDGSAPAATSATSATRDAASDAAGARASTPGSAAQSFEAVPSPRGDGALRAAAGTASAATASITAAPADSTSASSPSASPASGNPVFPSLASGGLAPPATISAGAAPDIAAAPTTPATAAGAASPLAAAVARSATASLLEASPLLRSGLVLAGANQRARRGRDEEDGILTAEEIAGLDLSSAQWAVLSACDTGGGDWQAGEGVVGLRRAFLVAGARTVILSLWPVIDTVASDWMAELYRGKFVRNASTGAAVRTASRTLLTRRRAAGQSTHPIYWAGFVATGEWR